MDKHDTWKNKVAFYTYLATHNPSRVQVLIDDDYIFSTVSKLRENDSEERNGNPYVFYNQASIKASDKYDSKALDGVRRGAIKTNQALARKKLPQILGVVEDAMWEEKTKILEANRYFEFLKIKFMYSNVLESKQLADYESKLDKNDDFQIYEVNGDDPRFKATEELVREVVSCLVLSMGMPTTTIPYFTEVFTGVPIGPKHPLRWLVGTVENGTKIACVGSIFISTPDVFGIYNIGTKKEYRGHGHGSKISLHCMKIGKEAGCAHCILEPSHMGEPIYKKIGFTDLIRRKALMNIHHVNFGFKIISFIITNPIGRRAINVQKIIANFATIKKVVMAFLGFVLLWIFYAIVRRMV
jgi:ribosomal protein S18 acetylase RimI-like enzyme